MCINTRMFLSSVLSECFVFTIFLNILLVINLVLLLFASYIADIEIVESEQIGTDEGGRQQTTVITVKY